MAVIDLITQKPKKLPTFNSDKLKDSEAKRYQFARYASENLQWTISTFGRQRITALLL
jgi:hypothetical protein